MANEKTLSEKEWREVGDLSKKIRADLMALHLMASKGMGKRHSEKVRRSLSYLETFRNEAENLMFAKGFDARYVFYGDKGK